LEKSVKLRAYRFAGWELNLRTRKLEPDPSQPRYIKTERGAGYVFAA